MPRTDETLKGAVHAEPTPKKALTSESAKARKQMFGTLLDLFGSNSQNELTESAIASTSALIEKQPENPLLYASRASYYKQAKQYEDSINDYTKALELGKNKQLAYMWLEGRALVYDTLRKESESLNDLCEVISIQPNYIPAHFYRGRIYNTRKEPVKALADFNFVIEANPEWNPDVYYARGMANLSVGNALQAALDFKHFLECEKWKDRSAPYAVLFGYLAFKQSAKHLDAQALVSTSEIHLQGTAWPNIIVQFFLGKASQEKVLNSASSNDDLTEAHWFIGAKHLYDARPEDARKHLTWVVEHGNESFLDYDLARAELNKLLNPA